VFEKSYIKPVRTPKLGHYQMIVGILMLLFIGFNRIGHFAYIRNDGLLCRFFKVVRMPVVSTFWRYADSLSINQAKSLLNVMSVVRERLWQQCGINYRRIHLDIDTTVETLYGSQQGGRKGHNTKHQGKKGYRPILCFVEETREYLTGKLRRGATVGGKECAAFIKTIKNRLPGCVESVVIRADGEFLSSKSIAAMLEEGYDFIIGNKQCEPKFDPNTWYRPWKRKAVEYNSCMFKPFGWKSSCRFVVMRIPKDGSANSSAGKQLPLFDEDRYKYRIFCTTLTGKTHKVIAEYDKRADVENLVGEAKREGLESIPSKKFKNNYAWFQLVMLSYNLWRYMKILAHASIDDKSVIAKKTTVQVLQDIRDNTIRIGRLKLLYIAAKMPFHDNRTKVKYSIHDTRTSAIMHFLSFLDKARARTRAWLNGPWQCRFALNTV
jgi:hypothetical protein